MPTVGIQAMIGIDEMNQILAFVSKRWEEMSTNPENRVMQSLPSNFWMNSVGGKAGQGRWITALMYTESEADAQAFKDVLLRWQTKGMEDTKAPDLIQINDGKKN